MKVSKKHRKSLDKSAKELKDAGRELEKALASYEKARARHGECVTAISEGIGAEIDSAKSAGATVTALRQIERWRKYWDTKMALPEVASVMSKHLDRDPKREAKAAPYRVDDTFSLR